MASVLARTGLYNITMETQLQGENMVFGALLCMQWHKGANSLVTLYLRAGAKDL